MTNYEYNSTKPEKILTGYGTVRGAELKRIYQHILESIPRSEINTKFARPRGQELETDHIDNCIRFLRTLDMVVEENDVVAPLNQRLFEDFEVSFEPRILYHIKQQTEKQSHLAAIHEIAIREISSGEDHYGARRVSVDELEVAVERNTDYDLQWREEKILMWANLLSPLGAISFSSSHDEILLSPSRVLIHELLYHHQENRSNPESLASALTWVDQNFLPVFSRVSGQPRVHSGIASVFESMVEDDVLSLRGMSDRTETVNLPMIIDQTETPADYSLQSAPKRPSYWYPLERSERRLST